MTQTQTINVTRQIAVFNGGWKKVMQWIPDWLGMPQPVVMVIALRKFWVISLDLGLGEAHFFVGTEETTKP